jgi:hypothetical protein
MAVAPETEPIDQEFRSALTNALQIAPQGQWLPAADSLRRFADDGNPIAIALVAMWMGNAGQFAQGLPYAERAVRGPIAAGPIAVNYANWVANDPNLRDRAPEFWQAAVDVGWAIDPIGQAQTIAQQGNPDGAISLLQATQTRTLPQLERAWEQLNREIAQSQQRLDADLTQVSNARSVLSARMNEDASAIEAERKRIEELVGETTSLIQNVAADNLASEYAKRATAASGRSRRWTYATLASSVVAIAIAAAFVLIGLANHHSVGTVLAKAAISIPFLALAAYLNKQATDERRDARSWTHIELQIRTARPYLGNLPEALRDEVQAALALRFFPGQAQDPHGGTTADSDPDEALKLIKEILGQARQGQVP